jgi:hypothetical protein
VTTYTASTPSKHAPRPSSASDLSEGIDRHHRLIDSVHHSWFNSVPDVLSRSIELDVQRNHTNAGIAILARNDWDSTGIEEGTTPNLDKRSC